jgi:hypothetical protein
MTTTVSWRVYIILFTHIIEEFLDMSIQDSVPGYANICHHHNISQYLGITQYNLALHYLYF